MAFRWENWNKSAVVVGKSYGIAGNDAIEVIVFVLHALLFKNKLSVAYFCS